jgi:uncharacterized membrane protein (DUF485 family)
MSAITDTDIKSAAKAHERVMINLACFHLVIPVAALTTGYIKPLLLCAFFGAILMLISQFVASKNHYAEWVKEHWHAAWLRSRLLLVCYTCSVFILVIGYLVGSFQTDPKMAAIFLIVFMRIAAVPILLGVLVLFVLETSALSQAKQGLPVSGPFTQR